MNTVEPIRDLNDLENICNYLKKENDRDYMMLVFGIFSGLRISDILSLKIRDVKDKSSISIREKKTRKINKIKINKTLKKSIDEYVKDKDPDDFLIKSRKGYNKPITRIRAYQILKSLEDKFDIEDIGCHSLRKTFGYHYYKNTKDIATLQMIFNHSSPVITLAYIGINQDIINDTFYNFRYF